MKDLNFFVRLKNLYKLSFIPRFDDIFEVEDGTYLPCYITRCRVIDVLMNPEDIHYFIEQSAEWNKRGILIFSVTEKDKNHKLFLEAAAMYEGVTITQCQSRLHGDYLCWMIAIPTT